jgi:hypothetical protein
VQPEFVRRALEKFESFQPIKIDIFVTERQSSKRFLSFQRPRNSELFSPYYNRWGRYHLLLSRFTILHLAMCFRPWSIIEQSSYTTNSSQGAPLHCSQKDKSLLTHSLHHPSVVIHKPKLPIQCQRWIHQRPIVQSAEGHVATFVSLDAVVLCIR